MEDLKGVAYIVFHTGCRFRQSDSRRKKMKRLITILLIIIGALGFMALFASIGIGAVYWYLHRSLPEQTVLTIDFQQEIVEYDPNVSLTSFLMEDTLTLRGILDALDAGSKDPRVVGLVARIGTQPMGMAHREEIRDALKRFSDSGKFTMAFSETFGEVSAGNGQYFLATAFKEIYLQPSGDIGLTGLFYETLFLREVFDRVGIVPRMDHRHEYKNAMNMYTETQFDDAQREAMQSIMDSHFDAIVTQIAESRSLPVEQVRTVFDEGPYLGAEAVEAGLVDGLKYHDEVVELAITSAGGECTFYSINEYAGKMDPPHDDGDVIALIYGIGMVQRGESEFNLINRDVTMGSDTVNRAFRAAIDDDDVKAIVFRVDSPGGSYVASDAIWRETVRAQKAGKPVVVTMGNVAASGGYFVSMSADKIVAQPTTITGSIGVLGGKLFTAELWKKIGINWDHVQSSANASMWTGTQDYTEKGWERFQAWLDRIYVDFTQKVASGRDMPIERARELAKGRVWTGKQALESGLIDALGGYETAIHLAKECAGIAPDDSIDLVVYPKTILPFENVFKRDTGFIRTAIFTVMKSLETLKPLLEVSRKLGLTGSSGALLLESNPAFE
jgi:protease IV